MGCGILGDDPTVDTDCVVLNITVHLSMFMFSFIKLSGYLDIIAYLCLSDGNKLSFPKQLKVV